MSQRFRLLWPVIVITTVLVALVGVAPSRPAYAAAATFTVTARSAYLRDTPASSSAVTYSVFRGQTYNILGRTDDSAWVRLDLA
ncbi:MAG: hypothetical protein ABI847_08490, partial [Anaerolineales bacterium]